MRSTYDLLIHEFEANKKRRFLYSVNILYRINLFNILCDNALHDIG